MKRHFKTLVIVIMAMAICVSCKKDNDNEPTGGGEGTINDHEYVDLGLPSHTLWATCNVGASKPEDKGDYFAWGETKVKDMYKLSTYKWFNYYDAFTKYNMDSIFGIVDNKMVLDLEDDAAYINWGENWRMPTFDELKELKEKCTWTWCSDIESFILTGPNQNSIFMPAAGYFYENQCFDNSHCYYWSSSLSTRNPATAYFLNEIPDFEVLGQGERSYGYSVRPVRNFTVSQK